MPHTKTMAAAVPKESRLEVSRVSRYARMGPFDRTEDEPAKGAGP
jgi:hypothetical protein